jgi:hypothetical protein
VERAKDYISYVMQQRQGPKDKVTIDATRFRDDLSIVDVPEVPILGVPPASAGAVGAGAMLSLLL